jgi:hypothetical protein
MGTPDNPEVFIQFYEEDVSIWRELITRSKSFTVKDAGVLKIPQATVTLREPPILPEKCIQEGYKLLIAPKPREIGGIGVIVEDDIEVKK